VTRYPATTRVAGHGAGASTTKLIEEGSDVRAFVAERLDMSCP